MMALNLSARINTITLNEEAESGAVTSDDLGKFLIRLMNIEAEDDDG
mgnify:CR=1 FL=1